jgi:hypothetical protein
MQYNRLPGVDFTPKAHYGLNKKNETLLVETVDSRDQSDKVSFMQLSLTLLDIAEKVGVVTIIFVDENY